MTASFMRQSDNPSLISQQNRRGLRNPWVLGMLALILVVLIVNATFIWLSTQDNRSTLVDREYKSRDRKTGTEFLNELGTRQAMGWQVTVKRPPAAIKDEPVMYDITVNDREGKPVSGEMIVEAYRAADAKRDFDTRFKEVSVGAYQGFISFPLKGYWELNVRIARGDEVFSAHADRFTVAESR